MSVVLQSSFSLSNLSRNVDNGDGGSLVAVGGPVQLFPPIFGGGAGNFSKHQKPKKNRQTLNKERPIFRHDDNPPPPSAHFQLFGGRQYIVKKISRHRRLNRLTSINVDFVRPDDGDVDLIRRISAETSAKISWGLVTPC